jgi:hypothetical protein
MHVDIETGRHVYQASKAERVKCQKHSERMRALRSKCK